MLESDCWQTTIAKETKERCRHPWMTDLLFKILFTFEN